MIKNYVKSGIFGIFGRRYSKYDVIRMFVCVCGFNKDLAKLGRAHKETSKVEFLSPNMLILFSYCSPMLQYVQYV